MRRPARGRGAPGCGQFPRFPALGACPRSAIPRGQARRTVIPGTSSNPASGCACTWSRWSSDGSRLGDSAAIYSAQPRLRADSNVDGIVILADGASKRLPRAFPTGACPRGVTLEAPATVPDEANQDDDLRNHDMRYRFHSWSDGESRSHEVAVPATDGRVRLKLTHEYRLRTSARNQTDKNHVAIDISPPFEDGFYADSYGGGEYIRLGVTFTEPVVVSGIPTLALTMESGERLAAWPGSTRSRCGGDWTLGFRVRADDSAPGGIGIASDALAPNGGSIRTAAGTEASLAVVSDPASDAKHKVNGRRPRKWRASGSSAGPGTARPAAPAKRSTFWSPST